MSNKEKLSELLTYAKDLCSIDREAEFLLTNGVTFAKDTDVPSKWVSKEDRLPSIYERVLVWCESKTIEKHVTACTYMGDGKFSRHVRCVTHWMPLPKPPKEEPK